MYKTRTKLVTERYGGSCPGWDKVKKDCNTHKCPGKFLFISYLTEVFVTEVSSFLRDCLNTALIDIILIT